MYITCQTHYWERAKRVKVLRIFAFGFTTIVLNIFRITWCRSKFISIMFTIFFFLSKSKYYPVIKKNFSFNLQYCSGQEPVKLLKTFRLITFCPPPTTAPISSILIYSITKASNWESFNLNSGTDVFVNPKPWIIYGRIRRFYFRAAGFFFGFIYKRVQLGNWKQCTCCPCVYSTPATRQVAAELSLSSVWVVESSSSTTSSTTGLLPAFSTVSGTRKKKKVLFPVRLTFRRKIFSYDFIH